VKIWTVVTLIALAGVIILPQVVLGQDPVAAARTQLTTARFHAGELAQRGTAVAGTQLHLRHVINCLEGPQGKNFTAAAGNVCQGQGNAHLRERRADRRPAGCGQQRRQRGTALRVGGGQAD